MLSCFRLRRSTLYPPPTTQTRQVFVRCVPVAPCELRPGQSEAVLRRKLAAGAVGRQCATPARLPSSFVARMAGFLSPQPKGELPRQIELAGYHPHVCLAIQVHSSLDWGEREKLLIPYLAPNCRQISTFLQEVSSILFLLQFTPPSHPQPTPANKTIQELRGIRPRQASPSRSRLYSRFTDPQPPLVSGSCSGSPAKQHGDRLLTAACSRCGPWLRVRGIPTRT